MQILNYLTFVLSAAIAGLVVIIARDQIDYSMFTADVGSWGVFFTVFGVLYAIMLGFLLIEALEKYNGISDLLDKELNELQDLRDALIFLDNDDGIENNIREKLKAYAKSIAHPEWNEMKVLGSKMSSDTSKPLYDLMHAVHAIEITNESDKEVLKIFMEKTFNVTTLRTQRINLSNQVLPPRLQILILFMSFVLVIGFILMAVTNLFIHLFMVATLTASVHLLYAVMRDLDNPFDGVWNLSRDDLDEFAESV